MKKKVILENGVDVWDAKKRYKVNQVVLFNGLSYQNVTGANSSPDSLVDWVLTDESITRTSDLINDGEDGINKFISLLDLPNNLVLYPTNVASDVSGYSKMVTDIHDADFNETAVDISTGSISVTAQLIASLASSAGIIEGNPGVFNVTTIGNITRTAGSGTAEFFFRIYKRNLAGTETLITESSNTIPVTNTGYSEFSATALWDDGDWLTTDRIVIKYYANRIVGGSNPNYSFQFGGNSPVRTLVPIPLSVVPNNSIPLSGTVTGKEVTGNIELANEVKITNNNASISFEDDIAILRNEVNNNTFTASSSGIVSTFDDGVNNVQFSVVDSGITVSDSNGKGIQGLEDFSPNITELDYTQKVYVDKKLSWTNVKFFGAVGDGVTDDATAIQSAIDFLNTNGGGTLFFPKGIYGIATAIQPKDGVYMIGEGVDLDFQANCPDLKFVIIGGSYFVPLSGLEYCIKANAVDSAGVSSGIKALSNVHFKDFGIKGFKYPIKIGAINQLGMGMGGFENIIIDGTASNNTTVVTQQGIELYNAQQISNKGIFMYNVRNGLKIFNSKETPQCSSGNSVWDKVYVYLDPSVTSETSVAISSITTGTKTTIVTSGNHNLKVGDIFQVNGVTGTDAGIFSRVLKVAVVDSATQIQTDLTSTGKTITATGTLEKGRTGIHLCAEGIEPLNHITFIAPQVNAFLASANPNKAIVNIAVCGTLTSRVGAVNFIETDTEGLTDGHFYLDGCANLGVKIATVINTFPFGHMAIYNTDSLVVNANDVDLTLKIGDLRYSDGNNNINVNGYVKTFLTNSRFPSYGMWRTVESSVTKSYIGADSVAPAFVLDNTTSGIAKSSSDTWKPLRIMEKRDSAKITGTATISLDRCGYLECTNASDAIITIPKVGTGTNEAKVGIPIVLQKVSGAGKVNIISADSTQKVGGVLSSAGGYELNAVAGSSVMLMASGFDSWVFVGGRNL